MHAFLYSVRDAEALTTCSTASCRCSISWGWWRWSPFLRAIWRSSWTRISTKWRRQPKHGRSLNLSGSVKSVDYAWITQRTLYCYWQVFRGIAIDCMLIGQEKATRVRWKTPETMVYTQPKTGIAVSRPLLLLQVTNTFVSTKYTSKWSARRPTGLPIGLNGCWPAWTCLSCQMRRQ